MKNSICLFEDESYSNFLPLVYLRPVYDLRCGILTLREKITARYPKSKILLHSRKLLEDVLIERNPKKKVNHFSSDTTLFINGRIIFNDAVASIISKLKVNTILKMSDTVVAALLSPDNVKKIHSGSNEFLDFGKLNKLTFKEIKVALLNYPWDLVNNNGKEIERDFNFITKKRKSVSSKFKSVEIVNQKKVFIEKGAKIDPFVFLDASDGPIYIGKNARIMSHSSIQGPCYIGENSVVKMHASIYHNVSIGEVCKVGGEIEESIIHSYSNKQHEGFLGHSYLGSWVNIGASTNNSDLKNNYSSVEVIINGKKVDSNSKFVGLIMGDHSKTAINTMFNTGTNIGVSCNIFGAGFPPKYIPSFCWGGTDFVRTYNLKKSLEVAEIVMNRRKIILTENEKKLFENVFAITESERNAKNIH